MSETIGAPGYSFAYRRAAAVCAFLIPVLCVLWNLDVTQSLGLALLKEQYLATILGLVFGAAFFSFAASSPRPANALFLAVCGLAGTLALLYCAVHYKWIIAELAYRPTILTVLGVITLGLVLEGLRRTAGMTMFLLVSLALVYALFAHLVPGSLQGRRIPFERLVQYVAFDPSAIYSAPLTIGATVIILFVFFGNVLFLAGGGTFFTDLALALTGRARGGSAKIAVLGSALFGSISGSAVSNVVTTGVVTIPLMKKGGYKDRDAGAIEAVASTGGQLAPPIMGAAAFLMAVFLEISYLSVVVAATLPAIIYYASLFIQVDLMAARDGIKSADEDIHPVRQVMAQGWHLLIPFVLLFATLFWLKWPPEMSAMVAGLAILIAGTLRSYRGERVTFSGLIRTTIETGQSMVPLILIVAGAGMVIGVLNATGLGFALSMVLLQAVGTNAWALILIAAVICIILGMGMPTSGVYVLLATLVAPSLVQAGIAPIAAHLFILYLGMMSMITPPIALAAFAAATISGASPMATGMAAVRIGWSAFVLPFLFVASPSLVLEAGAWLAGRDFVLALVGIYSVSAALVGYAGQRLGVGMRAALAVAGALALPFNNPGPELFSLHTWAAIVCLVLLALTWRRLPWLTGAANARRPSN